MGSLPLAGHRSTRCCLCRRGCVDADVSEVCEEVLHVDAQGLAVAVDGSPGCGFAAESRPADASDNGGDTVLSQGE